MRYFLLLLIPIFLHSLDARAQFAIINDPDGYTNVRSEPNASSPIVEQINDGEVFWIGEGMMDPGDWIPITAIGEKKFEGYIHRSRVVPFENLQEFKNHSITDKFLIFSNKNTILELMTGLFDPETHEVELTDGKWVNRIDGESHYGTDGGLPTREIKWIRLIIDSNPNDIPRDSFNELFQPSLKFMKVWLGPKNKIYLEMHNSDGAGAYSAAMVFKDGKFVSKYAGIFL